MNRLIIAITGASGAIYGVRALEALRDQQDIETHLILSKAGMRTIREETDYQVSHVTGLADVNHNISDIGASVSSGSFLTKGMLIAPCSIKTLSGIAMSFNQELVVRAADVCLKERRPVVLLLRETPLHQGHISLMAQATANGAIVMPPAPAFYHRPKSLDDIVDQTVRRALDLFDVNLADTRRWTES